MKKVMFIAVVVALILSLSVTVFARYEVCPECHGRMIEWTGKEREPSFCEETGTFDDTLVIEYGVLECTSCDYYEDWVIDQYIICPH